MEPRGRRQRPRTHLERQMIKLTDEPLDLGFVAEHFAIREGVGSVAVHFAVVKPIAEGRPTTGICFTATGDAEDELQDLERRLHAEWEVEDIVLVRRIGELRVGEVISIVVVAAARRKDAFGACGEAVERFKKIRGLQKEELFES